MNRIAVIATHHKAGTVWMNHTFRTIAKKLDIRFLPTLGFMVLPEADRAPPLILSASNGREGVEPGLFDREDVRIFHLIRDPRDVLISSMHYHRRAKENWLLRTGDDFGGQTYQAALNARASDRERYDFEMRNATAKNVANMLGWDYDRASSFECRYEDLIRDTERKLFADIVRHLGFAKEEIPLCRRVFWKLAIFGGKADAREDAAIAHVRSGEPEQWRGVFDRRLGETFLAQFGDALIRLGYEKDDAWRDDLPEHRPELDAASVPSISSAG
jgi:hypothetical protein